MRAPVAALALAAVALVGACGDDTDSADTGTTVPTTEAPTTSTSAAETTTTPSTTSDDVAAAASAAAEAFLAAHFPGSTATLSAFRQGDARSGEVEVFRPTEGGGPGASASTLLLRLDESDEWQVFAAVNGAITITAPEQDAAVPAEPLAVAGEGRGFEATLVVRAFDAAGEIVAEAIAMGGAFEASEPYEATLDLSGVAPGTPLLLLVAGGTGLDGDPGEFSAFRITVS